VGVQDLSRIFRQGGWVSRKVLKECQGHKWVSRNFPSILTSSPARPGQAASAGWAAARSGNPELAARCGKAGMAP
jgi:hypothetical protein